MSNKINEVATLHPQSYFHDSEFTMPNGTKVTEKGRLYRNVRKDGSFVNYAYECKYTFNGVSGTESGLVFSDPDWAHVSENDISRAIVRKLKSK